MQCPCGGSTKDHAVQRAGRVVAEYRRCTACGRVGWIHGREHVHGATHSRNTSQGDLLWSAARDGGMQHGHTLDPAASPGRPTTGAKR